MHGITKDDDDNNEEEYYDVRKWTSRHYDSTNNYNYDDDDDDHDKQKIEEEEAIVKDLYEPKKLKNTSTTKKRKRKKTNKRGYEDDNDEEGADEEGVFLSLEVIPGDAYRVETTNRDAAGGYVTKIVYNTNSATTTTPTTTTNPTLNNNEPEEECTLLSTTQEEKDIMSTTRMMLEKTAKKERRRQKKKKQEREEKKELKVKDPKSSLQQKEELPPENGLLISASSPAKDIQTTGTTDHKRNEEENTPYNDENDDDDEEINEATSNLRTSWSIHSPGVVLHTTLCTGLVALGYDRPTPIQSASLPAAMLGRRDIVGAAPTGSGKTLAYGLPILQYLLDKEANYCSSFKEKGGDTTTSHPSLVLLQALILVPTRELAMQVTSELTRVCCNKVKIGTIVGGFAEVKQRRILEKKRSPVLVATPGRLWELMASKDYEHLNNFTELRFLVIDEADRMIKQGSFPQLQQIFDVINRANPPPIHQDDEGDIDGSENRDDDDVHRLKSLSGVRGEAKVVMLNDAMLAAIERERNNSGSGNKNNTFPTPMEMDDTDFEQQLLQMEHDAENSSVDSHEHDEGQGEEIVHRQTFIYSATLTLPPSMHHLIKKDYVTKTKTKKGKGASKQPITVDGAIAEILDIAGARGEIKIVDLSNSTIPPDGKKTTKISPKDDSKLKGTLDLHKSKDLSSTVLTRLPPGLTLGEIRCAQMHKDSHLYAYLVTTRQGSSGPCLIFCNSIAAVRRVGETLKVLGLPSKTLHAQMAQKSRLGALESLRSANSRSIVVASDVAARGLDIPSVTTVIHYDVARVVDTFIHRAGRTARGVGEKAVGTSISLVAPAEEREHQKICEAVRGSGSKSLELVQIDPRLLNEAQERVALASKIVSCNDVESQATRKNKWLKDAAKEAELEIDEDMIEGGLLDGDQRDRQRFLEAKRAKTKLRELLAKPIRKQHFGKFLSGVGLRESIQSEGEVKPFIVQTSKGKRRRLRTSM